MNLAAYHQKLAGIETYRWTGAVTELVGLLASMALAVAARG